MMRSCIYKASFTVNCLWGGCVFIHFVPSIPLYPTVAMDFSGPGLSGYIIIQMNAYGLSALFPMTAQAAVAEKKSI